MTTALSEMTAVDSVENIVIFVSDALRRDFLPTGIAERGVTATAIAPSTFTASSLPSLTTGQYPATHGVWMFDNQLAETPPLLSASDQEVGFNAETVWTELPAADKPPLQINHVEKESKLEDLSPPFTYFVHDIGPHAPYGFTNEAFESTKEFFSDYENRRPQLADLYQEDCHNSAQRFLEIYERLEQRDLLESTLMVFTSDHGQCLGEVENGGRFGHGHPICPENVEIPIVFMGAGLPTGRSYDQLLSGIDIAPTVLSAQRDQIPSGIDGASVWRSEPPVDRKPRTDVWQHLDVEVAGLSKFLTVYAGTSVWNETGGHVFHRKSRAQRLLALTYDNLFRGYGPAWRKNTSLRKLFYFASVILSEHRTYGTPDFTVDMARTFTPDDFSLSDDQPTTLLTDDQESQLQDLGYLQ